MAVFRASEMYHDVLCFCTVFDTTSAIFFLQREFFLANPVLAYCSIALASLIFSKIVLILENETRDGSGLLQHLPQKRLQAGPMWPAARGGSLMAKNRGRLKAGALRAMADVTGSWTPWRASVPAAWRCRDPRQRVLRCAALVSPEEAGLRVIYLNNPGRRGAAA